MRLRVPGSAGASHGRGDPGRRDGAAEARRDWIHWITSGKKAETRVNRIAVACDKLACGNRRACCFDRSGMYSKGNMGAPEAAE